MVRGPDEASMHLTAISGPTAAVAPATPLLLTAAAAAADAAAAWHNTQPDRQTLGDILLWFASAAAAEPTATLVMWQATRDDKAWLTS